MTKQNKIQSLLLAVALAVTPATGYANDPVSTLQLDQMQHMTNVEGKIIPRSILQAQVGRPVCIHIDGKEYQGLVIRREEALKEYVKVYGEVIGKVDGKDEQCGFGLYLSFEGKLEGAFLFRETKRTYVVEYDDLVKGFTFKFKVSQENRPFAIN